MKIKYLLPLTSILVTAPILSAQTISGYTYDGQDLETITINGTTYGAGQLINSSLSAIVDTSGNLLYPSATPPATPSTVLSDLSATTGLSNVNSFTSTFDAPIVNGAGLDLFIFDWGNFAGDSFTLTINGESIASSSLGSPYSTGQAFTSRVLKSDGFNSVAEMDSTTFTDDGQTTTAFPGVWGFDLSDFNVGDGASITSLTYVDGSATSDPLLIMGIPEPHTYALIFGAFATGLVLIRRKRRT